MSPARLARLCVDLLDERVVEPRWALVTGKLGAATPLALGNELRGPCCTAPHTDLVGTTMESDGVVMTVEAFGSVATEVAAALTALPADRGDIAVYFTGLDFDNPQVAEAYEGLSNPDVAAYALAEPATIWDERDNPDFMDPDGGGPIPGVEPIIYTEHHVQSVFATYTKRGPSRPEGPLRDVLRRHFGDDMLECCAYS
ncbi:hypothetical protein [Streptomyces mayteni]